jgi:tripartite-type tricarboxylate transporter receptor subunit TctC
VAGSLVLKGFIFGVAALVAAPCWAEDSVEQFYRGKTVEFIVGAAAGGGFDLTTRPLLPYLTKYMPGHPNFVVRNMPGAAGIIMTNYLTSAAPKDGTVIGMATSNVPFEPRLKTGGANTVRYDPQKLGWIGTPVREPQVSWVWSATGVKTWEDLKTKHVRFGATSPTGDNAIFPAIANKLLGLTSEIVTGYQGVGEIFLAIERGELEANNTAYSNLEISKADWLRDGKINVFMQFGIERLPSLKDVPTIMELVKDPDDLRMLRFFLLKFEMHRPIFAPPGIPPERLEALRTAFDKAMADPGFVADAKRGGIDIRPLGGKAIAALVDEVATTPEPIVDRLSQTVAEGMKIGTKK